MSKRRQAPSGNALRDYVATLGENGQAVLRAAVLPAKDDTQGWLDTFRHADFDNELLLRALFNSMSGEQKLKLLTYFLDPEDKKMTLAVARAWARQAAENASLERCRAEHVATKLDNATPKARKQKRDARIVYLHDVEKKSFGIIGQMLRIENPVWAGKDGKPMTYGAVKQAYHRHKEPLKPC